MNNNENLESSVSQNKRIAEYLQAGHSITALEALEMFGCFRLGAQIFDLKKKGMPIDMKMKKDEQTGKRYAVYFVAPAAAKKEQ